MYKIFCKNCKYSRNFGYDCNHPNNIRTRLHPGTGKIQTIHSTAVYGFNKDYDCSRFEQKKRWYYLWLK